MRRHVQILRALTATYIAFSLLMAALYWRRSPLYLLGFCHPAIGLWANVMFLLAVVFLVLLILLFTHTSVTKVHRVFLGTVLLFSVLNMLPGLFYAKSPRKPPGSANSEYWGSRGTPGITRTMPGSAIPSIPCQGRYERLRITLTWA